MRVLKGQQETSASGYLENIIAIFAGADQSMALEKDDPNDPNCNGCVWTWGDNVWGDEASWMNYGKGLLGAGSDANFSDTPVKVHGVNDVNFLEHIVAIAAGWDHCMALENDDPWYPSWLCPTFKGRVYTWGNNGAGFGGGYPPPHPEASVGGRLGDGTYTDRSTPVLVLKGQQETSTSEYLEHIVAIAAGEGHSLALDTNGRVYAWGDNQFGQLGNGKNDPCTTPVKVVGPDLNQNGIHEPNEGYLENIVAIYGGFNGSETVRYQRNWLANQTILNGDIDNDGTGEIQDVVIASSVGQTAIIDGFTITKGNLSGLWNILL